MNLSAPIIGINRHRLTTDGEGVTTLVAFHGCPLNCRYCLNPHCLGAADRFRKYSPDDLYDDVSIDELYFLATNGGVTFGGGEPGVRPEFIRQFRSLCGDAWQLNLETSLNIPSMNLQQLLPVVNSLIIDVKDLDPEIYRNYTGKSNDLVIENLRLIVSQGRQEDCLIRLPLIPGYNNESVRNENRIQLENLGFKKFDLFTYLIRNH